MKGITTAAILLPLMKGRKRIGWAAIRCENVLAPHLEKLRWSLTAGYPRTTIDGKIAYLHHLVYRHFHGDVPAGCEIDHRDGVRKNCLPENLRAVTRSVNIANSGKRTTNRSGFKGVSLCSDTKRWRASICIDYRCINLGRHKTKEEAARAVNEAYRKHFPTVRIPNPEVES